MSETEQSQHSANMAQAIAVEAELVARRMGASSVIVLIGMPDGEKHNAWGGRYWGRTLEVRGLLEYGYRYLLNKLVFPIDPFK